VTIDTATAVNASATAIVAAVGVPIFLMLSDIFPQLVVAEVLNTRCEMTI
jgi:hypothetical protein